jgi:Ca2+-binding EF-hand superfamily protein
VRQSINHRINLLMLKCDKNGDGQLTKEEIKQACRDDPSIVDLL